MTNEVSIPISLSTPKGVTSSGLSSQHRRNLLIRSYFAVLSGVQGARDKRGSEYYGRLIGNFNSYAHRVGGKVYAVDEDTVFIKGFTYDGLGPGKCL